MEIPVVNTPTLFTERTGNRLLLTWPAVAADFELDYTDNLAAPWQSLLTPRFVVGDRITVNVKLTSPARYYRLRRQEAEAQVPGN